MSEAKLLCLCESIRHDQKELASYKESTRADSRKIWEQEEKTNDMEHRFEVDNMLIERDYHTSLLESTDAAFKRGH